MLIIHLTMSLLVVTVQMVSTSRSTERLAGMARMESVIHNVLEDYSRISLVKEYLNDFKESSGIAMKEFGQEGYLRITTNPILSYRMIRRYVKFIRPFYKKMTPDLKEVLLKISGGGKPEVEMLAEWPCDPDLNDAMEALLRIHHVYNIDLEQFSAGNIMGTQTNFELTPKQCQEIGEYAIQLKQFTSGILWLEVALHKSWGSADVAAILKSLEIAKEAHDIAWDNKTSQDYFFFLRKLNETADGKRVNLRGVELHKGNPESKLWGLCSGQNYQTNEEISQLFCWHERRNAAWTINPLKIEQLSSSPYLIQIHDVLRKNKDIDVMKRKAVPRMERARGFSYKSKPDSFEGSLTSSALTLSLTRRVELITGLAATPPGASEPFFVQSYATGGQYGRHLDHIEDETGRNGNIVATILFYLENVDIGGYTAFPIIGVAAKPVKGSAIFWFNMLRNGGVDVRTEHAGCPVVLGQKWIMTKIIRFNAQMRTRPCGLNKIE